MSVVNRLQEFITGLLEDGVWDLEGIEITLPNSVYMRLLEEVIEPEEFFEIPRYVKISTQVGYIKCIKGIKD